MAIELTRNEAIELLIWLGQLSGYMQGCGEKQWAAELLELAIAMESRIKSDG